MRHVNGNSLKLLSSAEFVTVLHSFSEFPRPLLYWQSDMADAEDTSRAKHAGGRKPKNLGPVMVTLKPPDAICLLEIATRTSLEREEAARMLMHLAMKDGANLIATALREALIVAQTKAPPEESADEQDG